MSEQPLETPEGQPDETPDVTPEGPAVPAEPSEEEQHEEEQHEQEQAEQPGEQHEPQMLSQKQLEKALDRLDREATRHNSRVVEIMGEDAAVLLDCPLCDALTPGKIMPAPNTPERFPAVREFMGDAPARELKLDPSAHRCETCDGWGVVDTGSRTQRQTELPCPTCDGYGWTGQREALRHSPAPVAAVVPESNGQDYAAESRISDPEAERLRARGFVVIDPPPKPQPVG